MRLVAALAIALFSLPATAAEDGKRYEGGIFDSIVLDGMVQVRLTQGDRDQIFVAGGRDVQDAVEVRQSGNHVVITAGSSWRFWSGNKMQVDVQVRDLRELIISGASDVTAAGPFKLSALRVSISGSGLVRFDNLDANQLRFDVSGAGDGQLAGRVSELRLSVSGKGKVLADQLRASSASVSISGVGTAQLWATDTLRINVSGVGTVDYWGQPQVSRSSSGLATINARGDKR